MFNQLQSQYSIYNVITGRFSIRRKQILIKEMLPFFLHWVNPNKAFAYKDTQL